MFEKIVVRQASGVGRDFDAGLLAEVILFYGQVHLVIDYRVLRDMCQSLGVASVLRMLRSGYARLTFIRGSAVVITTTPGSVALHTTAVAKAGERGATVEDDLIECMKQVGNGPKEAKKHARDFLKLIAQSKLNDGSPKGPLFVEQFRDDLRSKPNLLKQARLVVGHRIGELAGARISRFNVVEVSADRFLVDTDLNWSEARAAYHRLTGKDTTDFGEATILGEVQDGFVDLGMAARYGSELLTTHLQEQLITERVWQITRPRQSSDDEIAGFNQKVLGDAFALREAINSGLRTFDDFLNVMDKARRFKKMLVNANPDMGLLGSYLQEVKKGTWLDGLIAKTARFSIFNIAAPLLEQLTTGTQFISQIGNAVDAFILDRMARGWRPNMFVEKELLPFMASDKNGT